MAVRDETWSDEFATRVAIVTGGAQGMGFACAERLARAGAHVAIVDVNRPVAEEAAAALKKHTGRHIAIEANVTEREDVERAIRTVTNELGTPAILVNSAGILYPTRFMDIGDDEWGRVIAVSLTGSFICAQCCLPAMMHGLFGRIVNFSSTAGKSVSTLGGAHYTAAKAGVLGLTRALAKEVAPYGITVNSVCPGLFRTAMTLGLHSESEMEAIAASFPVARMGEPSEVAALVMFLCSSEASYITGASLDINGGDLMI